jgi:hypothetical protein
LTRDARFVERDSRSASSFTGSPDLSAVTAAHLTSDGADARRWAAFSTPRSDARAACDQAALLRRRRLTPPLRPCRAPC